jgi:hypothetical protein
MESPSSLRKTVRTISVVQIVLALMLLLLLFTTPIAAFDYSGGSHTVWYNDSFRFWLFSSGCALLLLSIAYCGYRMGWAPRAVVARKYAIQTIALGTILMAASASLLEYVDYWSWVYGASAVYLGPSPIAFAIGGVLIFLIGLITLIGLVRGLKSRPAQSQ